MLRDLPTPGKGKAFGLDKLRAKTSAKWFQCEHDVIPASYAEMDFPVASFIDDTILCMLERSDWGYPNLASVDSFVEAFTRHVCRSFDWTVNPSMCLALTDVMQAISLCIHQMTERNDAIWIASPSYTPYYSAIESSSRHYVTTSMEINGGRWCLPLDKFEDSLSSNVTMILICNPHNPSGSVLERDDLKAIAAIARERGIVVVSDEIHMDLVHKPYRHVPFIPIAEEMDVDAVAVTSAGKGYNISGLRSAIAVTSNSRVYRKLAGLPEYLLGAPNALALEIAKVAWNNGADWLEETKDVLLQNRNYLSETFSQSMPEVKFVTPQATYLAWLNFQALVGREADQKILERSRVQTFGGQHFGAEWDGFIRLNFATPKSVLTMIGDRLVRLKQEYSRSIAGRRELGKLPKNTK